MARKAVISETVLAVLNELMRQLPDDCTSVNFKCIENHDEIRGRFTTTQLTSALMLLTRHARIIDLGRGNYRGIPVKRPIEGRPIPKICTEHGMSDEGIYFHQLNFIICRRPQC